MKVSIKSSYNSTGSGQKNPARSDPPVETVASKQPRGRIIQSWLTRIWPRTLFSLLLCAMGLHLILAMGLLASLHEHDKLEGCQGIDGVVVGAHMQPRSPRTKLVLLGPHDRYNFGDIIFTKVLQKMLTTRAGYKPNEILYGGLVSRNMSKYGGDDVLSMKRIQNLSRSDAVNGPYDIVYTGGEAVGCNFECAVGMFENNGLKDEARREKIHDCGYLIPKHLLHPRVGSSKYRNYAVVNSMGGTPCNECLPSIKTADYLAFRDKDPLYPDSAVMMKELYADVIESHFDALPNVERYIVVQHKAHKFDARALAVALDEVSRQANATIVFFAAGTVPHHDSIHLYRQVVSLMKEKSVVYESENMWKVIALISRAEGVLSTSLHVRIMAFIYFRPRVTWCGNGQKHEKFIALWDAKDSPGCVSSMKETWLTLKVYYGENPSITQEMTMITYDRVVKKYVESFNNWSKMLLLRKPSDNAIEVN